MASGDVSVVNEETSDRFLYLSIFSVSIMKFVCGAASTWTSPVLPKLRGQDGNPLKRPITISDESWITSSIFLSAILSLSLASFLIDRIGRKRTLLLAALPMTAAYLFTALGKKVEYFMVARFLIGLGYGPGISLPFLYLGEVSKSSNRGILGFILILMWKLGCLSSYVVGPYISVQNFSFFCIIPFIIFYISFGIFIPDTPHYYILKKDLSKAKNVLKKLRGNGNVDTEFDEIVQNVDEFTATKKNLKDYFKSKIFIKGLVICSGFLCLGEFTGLPVILAYTQIIFTDFTNINIAPEILSIILGIIYTVSCVLALPFIAKFGKRTLVLTSMVGVIVSLLLLCIYLQLQMLDVDYIRRIFWLPFFSLFLLSVSQNLGNTTLPWVYLGELFSPDVKAFGSSLVTAMYLLCDFVASDLFPIVESVGIYYCFVIFALFSMVEIIFLYFWLPETDKKTLQEIQSELNK